MEEQEDGWLTVLEKNGLGPMTTILEVTVGFRKLNSCSWKKTVSFPMILQE
jgi:hypothetical protein